MLHWRTDATILLTGIVVIAYTAAGGSEAVNVTQKYQIGVIFCGMIAAFVVLLRRMPLEVGLDDALALAGGFHKLNAVDFSVDASRRYTFWSGLLGGFFLALSYFGTDQSQVQRYPSGTSLRERPRSDVQRRTQDPHAILHPAAGDDGLRLLPVRAAAGLLQSGRVGAERGARR